MQGVLPFMSKPVIITADSTVDLAPELIEKTE